MGDFNIRLAKMADVQALAAVERSAEAAFRIFSDFSPGGPTVPEKELEAMVQEGLLWVAVDGLDQPVGFVGCEAMGRMLYVREISVAYDFQKKGIGRALMLCVVEAARASAFASVGLTTNRDVVWNLPFYETLGFVRTRDDENYPCLLARLKKEIEDGANPFTRCAMLKKL